MHDHDRFGELLWCDQGKTAHVINGEEIKMEAGDMAFIRPEDQHRFYSPRNRPFHLMVVCFAWHVYETFRQRYFPNDRIYGEDGKLPKMIRLTRKQLDWMRKAFFELYQAPRSQLHIDHYLSSVFLQLGMIPANKQFPLASFPQWMHKGLMLIRDPEHFRLGPHEFFRLCGRCPEHVTRVFRRITGETPSKYITHLRMQYAANLLSVTSQNILDIGNACGLESMSHFYSAFRKQYGMTPHAYRNHCIEREYWNV